MRITNKIMQNNNLANINTNKVYQDKLTNQMSTQKKINRPSDDPVVAIRALRLRSSVTEVSQYYSKNIPDAESWLDVTEDALDNLSEIITKMIDQCTKGANGDLTAEDRQIILEQLKALADEVYATGDADYAGRYVFTGYRTNTSLSFSSAETKDYTITEQLNSSAIDSVTVVKTYADDGTTKVDLTDINASNYEDIAVPEASVEAVEVYRIRLAYNNCDPDTEVTISYMKSDGSGDYDDVPATTISYYDDPYSQVGDDDVIFVPETGELLLGANAYSKLMALKDDITSSGTDESEIRVTYGKSDWQKGDLRPEHYFHCVTDLGGDDEIEYNASYLTGNAARQSIEYDVGFNQTIRVNSTADECFKHGIGREVDDLSIAMEELVNLEGIAAELEKLLENAGEDKKDVIQSRLDAVNKAVTLQKDKVQKMFEGAITALQGYLDDTNLCITDCGSRSSKLELIKNRMQTQKTTFETLKSENEDIDVTEAAIQLTSAEFTYEAALLAIGKIMQTSLLNFI